jgi:hypothetical protein
MTGQADVGSRQNLAARASRDAVADDLIQGWRPAPGAMCAKCGVSPVGPGGIICPDCRAAIECQALTAGRGEPHTLDGMAERPAKEGE